MFKTSAVALCALATLVFAMQASAQSMTWQYGYDAMGRPTTVVDPNGQTSYTYYDSLGRPVQTQQPANTGSSSPTVTGFSYNAADGLTQVTDPRNLATTYSPNGLGNVTAQTSPDTGASQYTYDALGNLLTKTDARGKLTQYTYDSINRLKTISYATGTGTVFEYDGGVTPTPAVIGELTNITDASGQVSYSYDSMGRKTGKTQTTGARAFIVGYSWGDSGSALDKLTAITYPSGTRVNYSYDAQGVVSGITVNPPNANGVGTNTGSTLPLLSAVTTNAESKLTGWTWASSKTQAIGYDENGQISAYNLGDPTTTGVRRTVVRDSSGRITGYTHVSNGVAVPTLDQSFGYDNLNRLISATLGSTAIQYGYDTTGNRTTKVISGTSYTNSTSATSNKLTQTQDVGGTATIQHDAAGNITGDGINTYTYNDRGRLATMTNAGGTVTYSYNALQLRVGKTGPTTLVSGGAAYYVYDEEGKLLGEYDANGVPFYETIYLGTPVGVVRQTGTAAASNIAINFYNISTDQLGAPRVITRQSDEAIVWRWDSAEAFGATAPDQNPAGLGPFSFNQRLPGQVFDAESGLFQNWNREYNPWIGRYMQSDPIGLEGGVNTFAYVEGNPLSSIDPRGLNTVYWGGAGLRGAYVESQVRALQEAGIGNVRSSTVGGGGNLALDANAVANLRTYPPQYGYLTPIAPYDAVPISCGEQNNYIGYSYGSLLAAQTAMHYANRGYKIDNLVLIGSPISSEFLSALRSNKNIKNILVKDLGFNGDPIRAGMSDIDLLLALPTLASDVLTPGAGHFYYSGSDSIATQRHKDLARELYKAGLR